MSAESAHHIKAKRGVADSPHARRPATRILFGILVAFAYAGILAGAGFFISGAVNSMNESTAVARATIDALREPARGDAAPAVSGASVAAPVQPVAATTAVEPLRPPAPALYAPPRDAEQAAPEAPQAPVAALYAPSREAEPAAPELQQADVKAAALPDSPHEDAAAPNLTVAPVAAPPPSTAAPARDLEARGDERLEQGDVASARLFYERAADAGNARAARRLGNSFDPTFLARWGVRLMRGDPAEAARWYRRADTLGDGEAAQDLAALPHH
jgi:hypothetical protein